MRAEQFIKQIRLRSDNVDSAGIGDDEILAYLNDAQDRLQSKIMQEHPEQDIFSMQGYVYLRYSEDSYSIENLTDINGNVIPQKLFAGNCLSMVEISQNFGAIQASNLLQFPNYASFPVMGETGYTYVDQSNGKLYRWQGACYIEILASTLSYNYAGTWLPVPQVSPRERTVGFGYFVRGNSVIIAPMPATLNTVLRVTGMKRLYNIDKRRGKISSSSSVGGKTTFVLSGIPTGTDFADVDRVTLVDANGSILQYTEPSTGKVTYYNNLQVDSFANPNLTVVLGSVPSTSTGCYIVYGEYSSSHCEVDDFCNRYLIESAVMRVQMRDSSRDVSSQSALVGALESEIMASYAQLGNDATMIPVNSTDYLYY